jgi:hypothetical protein
VLTVGHELCKLEDTVIISDGKIFTTTYCLRVLGPFEVAAGAGYYLIRLPQLPDGWLCWFSFFLKLFNLKYV